MLTALAMLAAESLAASTQDAAGPPAAALAALDDAHDGPVVGLSFDRELLAAVAAEPVLEGRDLAFEAAGTDPATVTVPEGSCGLWFARWQGELRMERVGECPQVTVAATTVFEAEEPAASHTPRRAPTTRGVYQHAGLIGVGFRKLHWSGTHTGPDLAWRGARWRATHLGAAASVVGGDTGPAWNARASWVLSPFWDDMSGPFVGPSLGLTLGSWAETSDQLSEDRLTLDPGLSVGWLQTFHPGFTLEAEWTRSALLPVAGGGLDDPFHSSLVLRAGWSFADGPAPAPDKDNQRRTAIGAGVVAGVVVAGIVVGAIALERAFAWPVG